MVGLVGTLPCGVAILATLLGVASFTTRAFGVALGAAPLFEVAFTFATSFVTGFFVAARLGTAFFAADFFAVAIDCSRRASSWSRNRPGRLTHFDGA